MKKSLCKLVALLIVATMMCSLAACGGTQKSNPSTDEKPTETQTVPATVSTETDDANQIDWSTYTDWMTTDWDSKSISYQFMGSWELPEYSYFYTILVNLYDDGSVLVDQRNTAFGSSYQQFGYWSEKKTDDGNEIAMDTLFCTPISGEELVAHEYHYDLYEESDGNYSFGYTFGITPGSFFRTADMTGSNEILYASLEDFYTDVDNITETYRFTSSETSIPGFSAVISVLSNYTVSAQLLTEYEGNTVTAHEDTGMLMLQADESGNVTYMLNIAGAEIPLTVSEDGSVGDFVWTCNWESQSITVDFTMTQAEISADDAAE